MDLEHERRLTEVENRSKANGHRIDELDKRQQNLDDLMLSVRELAIREEVVETDVKEIKSDVKSLAEKPAKRWEAIADKIIMMIVAAVVGYILAQVGL